MSDNVQLQEQLIIGIDFGTTYSSVAWYVVNADEVQSELRKDRFNTEDITVVYFDNQDQVKSLLAWYRGPKAPEKGNWLWAHEIDMCRGKIDPSHHFELFKLGLGEHG